METSIQIKSKTTDGKDSSKAITYIDSNATAAEIKSFAVALTGLTTNTYESTNRIDKTDIDDETAKETYDFEVTYNGETVQNPHTIPASELANSHLWQIRNLNSNVTIYCKEYPYKSFCYCFRSDPSSNPQFIIGKIQSATDYAAGEYVIIIPGNDEYQEAKFIVNVVEDTVATLKNTLKSMNVEINDNMDKKELTALLNETAINNEIKELEEAKVYG